MAAFTLQSDGTTAGEYFRKASSETTFDELFTHSVSTPLTMFDSSGTLVWAPHNLMDGSNNFDDGARWFADNITVSAGSVTGPDGSTALWALTDANGAAIGGLLDVGNVAFHASTTLEIWSEKDDDETRFPAVSISGAGGATVSWNTKTGASNAISGSPTIDVSEAVSGLWRIRITVVGTTSRDVVLYPAYGTTISAGSAAATGTTHMGFLAIYRSSLGGMADNPDMPAGLEKYVPTTTAAVYGPRRQAYRYNSGWELAGMQMEAAAATQLLHGTDSFATQTETVTAQAYTLQFQGTGSITLSGAHSATLNGTGAHDLVSLTFTPSAGTLTLTPSGTVNYPQLEPGSIPTSYIPNTAASGTVTRAAETLTIAGADSPISATEATLAVDALLTFDGNGPEIFNITSGGHWVRIYPRNAASTYAQWRPSYTPEVTAAQGGTISAGINQPVTVALGIKASDEVQLVAQGNAGTAVATTSITDFSGQDIGITGNIGEGSFFYKTIRIWSTKLPEADLVTAGTAS